MSSTLETMSETRLPSHLRHWGLYAEPFSPGMLVQTQLQDGFVESDSIQEVLARVYFTVEEQFPLISIVGCSGVGKTQLLDYACHQISRGHRRLLRWDRKRLTESPDQLLELLQRNWSTLATIGSQMVVVIDQVDQLSLEHQLQIGLLIETVYASTSAPTVIVSLTSPATICSALKTQLMQGLTAQLPAWQGAELSQIISKRLACCSLHQSPFTTAGLKRLVAESAGSPRRCLQLGHQALLMGAAENEPLIDDKLVSQAVAQLSAEMSIWNA